MNVKHECEANPHLKSLYLKEVNDTQDIEPSLQLLSWAASSSTEMKRE